METVGLIAAMAQESKALLRCIKGWNRIMLGSFHGFQFQFTDRNILLVISGMGLERARDATRTLLAVTTPSLLVSFGIAGAVESDLNIGDVVVAAKNCLLEIGLPGKFIPLANLSDAAWNAAYQVLLPLGARLVKGTAITTCGSQAVPEQLQGIANPVLEMETAGIAQVAAELGLPLVSIRSISDGPLSPIPIDLEVVMDNDYNFRIDKLIKIALQHPGIILRSQQILQNSRKAADHAAMAVVAALSQPSLITLARGRKINK